MLGRTILLLLLILVLSVGGIIWFDFLNVIDAKDVLAPLYKILPFVPGEPRTQTSSADDDLINLDAERLAVRLEMLELRNMEMDSRQKDIDNRYGELMQMVQDIDEQKKALIEQQNSINAQIEDAVNKDSNVDQLARYLTGMPPRNAVNILAGLDDQNAIDIIRKTEEIARTEGTASIVAFWFSLMEPAKAAELQRKMAGRPPNL